MTVGTSTGVIVMLVTGAQPRRPAPGLRVGSTTGRFMERSRKGRIKEEGELAWKHATQRDRTLGTLLETIRGEPLGSMLRNPHGTWKPLGEP